MREITTCVSLDISGEHLAVAAERIRDDNPGTFVRPVVAGFTRTPVLPGDLEAMPKLLFFPRSTIGDFTIPEAQALTARLHRLPLLAGLVIGADLLKERGPADRGP